MNEVLEYELMDTKKPLTLRINLKKLIDYKEILGEFYQEENSLTFEVSLIMQGEQYPTNCQTTKSIKLQKITNWDLNRKLEFDKLSFDAQLCFKLILNKNLPQQQFLGYSTFQLFDETLSLRTGKQLLIIWPFIEPQIQDPYFAPSEIDEPFYEKIKTNYFASQYENPDLSQFHKNKNIEACVNQSIYYNQSIPLLFLDCELMLENVDSKLIYLDHPKICIIEKEQHIKNLEVKNSNDIFYKFFVEKNVYNYLYQKNTGNSEFLHVRDHHHDFDNEDPILQMYLVNFDDEDVKDLKPNQEEKEMLEELIQRPNFYHFSPEEKAQFWKFRYYLKDFKSALPKFLISVNWLINKNIDIALEFIQEWSLVDYDDALFLLSRKFSANEIHPTDLQIQPKRKIEVLKAIRDYAVRSISQEKIDKIEFLILQLVACLRYDFLGQEQSTLVEFLFSSVKNSKKLTAKFYWNINVEIESDIPEIREQYKQLKGSFCEQIKLSQDKQLFSHLMEHISMREILADSFKQCIDVRGRASKATDKIREYFLKKKTNEIRELIQSDFFFFEENQIITKFIVEEIKVFNSNTRPIRLSFGLQDGSNFKIMYKFSDDMRQDQLIMQIFSLMDYLLKALSVDLRLTLYPILVYSGDDGIMQFVDDSNTVQNVLEENNYDMSKYLVNSSKRITEELQDNPQMVDCGPQEISLQSVRKDLFDNYMESCASYSVITYLLGIGDRHLENLLITNDCKLFHIDFGYAMGEDPKPYPPPFKLNKEMINVFAGKYRRTFIEKCVSYYLYLRKNAKVILNLMYLMIDSNLITNPKKAKKLTDLAVIEMAEKFLLDKTEVEAEQFFKTIIDQSVEAVFTRLWDTIHLYRARGWR